MKKTIDMLAVFGVAMAASAPVIAGGLGAPAPIAGVGIGAVALLGIGYRALRKRIDR